MGLRAAIVKGVEAAIKGLGDIPVTAVITHYAGDPVRDPGTGISTRTSVTYTDTGATFVEMKRYEGRADVLIGDRFLIVRYSVAPVIDVGDIVETGGRTYDVLADDPDPTETIHILHIRSYKRVIP